MIVQDSNEIVQNKFFLMTREEGVDVLRQFLNNRFVRYRFFRNIYVSCNGVGIMTMVVRSGRTERHRVYILCEKECPVVVLVDNSVFEKQLVL